MALERRAGPGARERLHAMFDQAGLPYRRDLERIPNSHGALAVAELVRDRGRHEAIHARLFEAYWVRGLDLGDEDVLVAEGRAIGLAAADIIAAIGSPAYAERISAYTQAASELGAGGVPAWLIDERLLVPGAQPHEVFERILGRLGHEPV